MRRTILWLFAASLLARLVLSALRIAYGTPPYLAYPVPWLEAIRLFDDFGGYYMNQLYYLAHGYLPYRDFGYNFPPLFLYVLFPFYVLGGPSVAGIPIFVSDAATAPALYLLTRAYATRGIALVAALAYALSPFFLIYEGYLWIGNQPMIFFTVLSLYLFRAKRPVASAIALGVAILFRQQALFILPAYALWTFREYGLKGARFVLLVLATILMVSAPFLLVIPGQYISSLSYLPLYDWTPLFGNPAAIRGSYNIVTVNFCTSVAKVASGFIMSCNFAGSSYMTFAPIGPPLLVFANNLSLLIRLPLAVMVLPLIYLVRNKNNSLQLASSYAAAISVTVFAALVHTDLRYYYLLFYGLILTAATTRTGLAMAIGASILSLLLPELPLQELLPFITLMSMILAQELVETRQFRSAEQPVRGLGPAAATWYRETSPARPARRPR